MEYIAGWTLGRLIKDLKKAEAFASTASVVDIVSGALTGLSTLHTAKHTETQEVLGIIHRDIAPKNIMVGEDGNTRLIDLGLGKSNLQDWRTSTGIVMGSPGYMAPEQVTADKIDHRVDLYAMGIVLWELLALKSYIKRAPVPIMLRAQVAPNFTPPSQHNDQVPAALDEICATALAIEPEGRFPSAQAFLQALREVVPEREEEAPLATVVGKMLWGELGASKTEVTKLLSVVAPIAQPEIEDGPQEVEVFAEKTKLVPDPSASPAALIANPATISNPAIVDPATGMPVAHMDPAAYAQPASPTPYTFNQPMSGPMVPPRQGVPMKAVVGLMLLTLFAGIGVGALLLQLGGSQPQEQLLKIQEVTTSPPSVSPSAHTTVTVSAGAPQDSDTPKTAEPSKRAASPVKRTVGSVKRAPAKRKVRRAVEPSPPPPVNPKAQLERLIARVKRFQKTIPQGAPKLKEARKLINSANMELTAPEIKLSRVRELEARLSALQK